MNITKCVSFVSYRVSGRKMLSEFFPISQAFRSHVLYRSMVPLYMFPQSHPAWSLGIHKAIGLQFCCSLCSSLSKVYFHHSSGCFGWKLDRHCTHTTQKYIMYVLLTITILCTFPLRCCIVFSVSLLYRRMDALLSATSTHASCLPVPAVPTQVLAEVGF